MGIEQSLGRLPTHTDRPSQSQSLRVTAKASSPGGETSASSDRDDVDRGAPRGESTTDHHHAGLDVFNCCRADGGSPRGLDISVLGEDDDESGLLSVVVLGDTVYLNVTLDVASCLDPKGLAVCDLGDARVGGDGGRRGGARRGGRGGRRARRVGHVVRCRRGGRRGGPGGPHLDGHVGGGRGFTTGLDVGRTPLGAD